VSFEALTPYFRETDMTKLLSALILTAFAFGAQAASHAGGAPMKDAAPAASAAKKAEMKAEKKAAPAKAEAKKEEPKK